MEILLPAIGKTMITHQEKNVVIMEQMDNNITAKQLMENLRGMVLSQIQVEPNMKVRSREINEQVLVNRYMLMVVFTPAIIMVIKEIKRELLSFQMDTHMKVAF